MHKYRGNEYWDMIRISNEEKEYPSNMGQKWTDEEERLLLEEINNNIDIGTIAQKHDRTIGGIESRRRQIAYNMFLEKKSVEEIIKKTKLDYDCIKQTIEKKSNEKNTNNRKKHKDTQIDNILITINKSDYVELQNDVKQMKTDIKGIKSSIEELVEMMKAVYEFEDV